MFGVVNWRFKSHEIKELWINKQRKHHWIIILKNCLVLLLRWQNCTRKLFPLRSDRCVSQIESSEVVITLPSSSFQYSVTLAILVELAVNLDVSIPASFKSSLNHLLKVCHPMTLFGFVNAIQNVFDVLKDDVRLIYSSTTSKTQQLGLVSLQISK